MSCIRSEKLRNLSITNYHVLPFYSRRLLPRLITLHLENITVKDGKELFHVLHDESKKSCKDSQTKIIFATKTFATERYDITNLLGQCKLVVECVQISASSYHHKPMWITNNWGRFQTHGKSVSLSLKASRAEFIQQQNRQCFKGDLCHPTAATSIRKLFLRRSYLDQKGLTALSASLHHLKNMKMLSLNGNHIGSAMAGLSPAIQSCENLQELNLSDSELTDTCRFVSVTLRKCEES